MCRDIFRVQAHALGLFFDEMINTFDPDALIVGGGAIETDNEFRQWVIDEIRAGMPRAAAGTSRHPDSHHARRRHRRLPRRRHRSPQARTGWGIDLGSGLRAFRAQVRSSSKQSKVLPEPKPRALSPEPVNVTKVTVRDLKKRYDSVEAARGVSFEILDGEIFGLIGPNGAGKTTTLECVIGLREPDEGAIEVCGIDARRQPRAVKEKIGAALQTTALQEKITPREALSLFGAFYRHRAEPAALLERFSLLDKADEPFDTLSGGQRQRLALALAFVNKPELVFLDEPTAGLDPHARRELHGEIAKMKDEGHTVLLTTHYLNEAEALCDRIAIIDHGRIIVTGTPQEIIARSSAAPSVRLTTVQRLEPGMAREDSRCRGAVDRRYPCQLPGKRGIGTCQRDRRRGPEPARRARHRGCGAPRQQGDTRGCIPGADGQRTACARLNRRLNLLECLS